MVISLFVFFPVLFSGGLVPYYILLVRVRLMDRMISRGTMHMRLSRIKIRWMIARETE